MGLRRRQPSEEALLNYAADQELSGRFEELLDRARQAEQALLKARESRADVVELRARGLELDDALTAAMRAAYAGQRVTIGPGQYDDRIVRRKGLAKPRVRPWTAEAERLLTLRETHRLTGVARVPRPVA